MNTRDKCWTQHESRLIHTLIVRELDTVVQNSISIIRHFLQYQAHLWCLNQLIRVLEKLKYTVVTKFAALLENDESKQTLNAFI